MPSPASLTFLTYKDSGSQSVTSTILPSEDENVVSRFLSQGPRVYLNGSGDNILDEVLGSSETITNMPNSITFIIPDDCDALSKIHFSYSCDYTTTSASSPISKSLGLELINKVEVRVGNELWETLKAEDILGRIVTEGDYSTSQEIYETITSIRGKDVDSTLLDPQQNAYNIPTTNPVFISGTLDLKIFSGSGDKINTFIQAGAPNNNVRLKIYFNDLIQAKSFSGGTITNFRPSLIVRKHLFTDVEKKYIVDNVINSVIHTSQNVSSILSIGTFPSDELSEFTFHVDLANININTSHLLLCIQRTAYGDNESSGTLNGQLTNYTRAYGQPNGSGNVNPGFYDCITSVDLIINGSSVTGKLPASYLKTNAKKLLGLNSIVEFPYYCIPIASSKFAEDSLVMSKLSNKKLIISTNGNLFGTTTISTSRKIVANITAVGTNIITYVGGNCSKQLSN